MFKIKYGFIKPSIDAHTMGLYSASELLKECGYDVLIADEKISLALDNIRYEENRNKITTWLKENGITHIGISYRLDEIEAANIMGFLVYTLKNSRMFSYQGGQIFSVIFGGLPKACEIIDREHNGFVKTFIGGETPYEFLTKIGVPDEKIPKSIIEGSFYDENRLSIGKEIIKSGKYQLIKPIDRSGYKEFGTKEDSVIKRLEHNLNNKFLPLMRAHVGPYSSTKNRIDSVKEFLLWAKKLADAGYLDILSIGTSQLTQSNFGEDWGDKPNGGGVPINSPEEYKQIWQCSRPLLIRTYAGTKNIPQLAKIHEETINICWHALSLWWFNKLDGRGPYDLYTNLLQHVETMKYIAKTNKPLEPNVSHHFSFRGGDDITYIVTAYLAAKLAKKMGIKTLILQNMLNTPKITWGIQDLAKSRAMLNLVKTLEDKDFKILLQTRAGLDYFKPNLEEAKIQLAAVTALMDDIDPHNQWSPPIIHVVSYSEASHLATPDIVNESIKITQYTLQKYRTLRKQGQIEDMSKNLEIEERMYELLNSAKEIIDAIEKNILNPYSPEGFYKIFASGFLIVPYLWGDIEEFKHATYWKTKPVNGSIKVVDEDGKVIKPSKIVNYAVQNIKEVEYILKEKSLANSIFN